MSDEAQAKLDRVEALAEEWRQASVNPPDGTSLSAQVHGMFYEALRGALDEVAS